jgi:tetratricopeptide (TPR) repeat protein
MLVGYRAGTTTALWLAAAALLAAGQLAEAQEVLQQALQASEHYEHRYCRMDLWRLRGLACQAQGDAAQAQQCLEQARRLGQAGRCAGLAAALAGPARHGGLKRPLPGKGHKCVNFGAKFTFAIFRQPVFVWAADCTTACQGPPPPPLLCLFGQPALLGAGAPQPLTLKYRKGLALLGFLAAHAERVFRRETLAELLWPDIDSRAGRANLRQVLADLGGVLRRLGLAEALEVQRDWLALRPGWGCRPTSPCWAAARRRRALRRALLDHLSQATTTWLEDAEDGTSDDFREWLGAQRHHLQHARERLLGALVQQTDMRTDGPGQPAPTPAPAPTAPPHRRPAHPRSPSSPCCAWPWTTAWTTKP